MPRLSLQQKLSYIYLVLVPFVTFVLGFALGHSRYQIYLPLWVINCCIMLLAFRLLTGNALRLPGTLKKQYVVIAAFMILPWMLFTVFAGMGPPPNISRWTDTAREQQARFSILMVGGVLFAIGFAILKDRLQKAGESFYSIIGFTAILIKLPLFLINMTFWGFFLTESFRLFVASGTDKKPDWYLAIQEQYIALDAVELSLTYVAMAAFAMAMGKTGWMKPVASRIYVTVSILLFVFCILPPSVPMPLTVPVYLASIPAISFLLPYLAGVNLLKKAAEPSIQ